MNVPANLKYSNDHEWCRVEGGEAFIGITDFAQSQLGDIVFVDVPTVGETLSAGDVFGSIEAVKTVSDAFIPVGAEVLEFNPAVDADPSIVNRDPYGEGWLVKVKLTDPKECESLLTDAQYKELIGEYSFDVNRTPQPPVFDGCRQGVSGWNPASKDTVT